MGFDAVVDYYLIRNREVHPDNAKLLYSELYEFTVLND